MKNFPFSLFFIVIAILTIMINSCSSSPKINGSDNENFYKLSIPQQEESDHWYGHSNYFNSNIENFAFSSEIGKVKSVYLGHSFNNEYKNSAEPLVVNDVIYILNARGVLTARKLDKPGKIIQSKRVVKIKNRENFRGGKISYNNGKIFVNTDSNKITVLSASDFSIVWERKINSIVLSTLVFDDSSAFLITNDNKTYALNKDNGSIRWIHTGVEKNIGTLGSADPVVYKDYLITSYSSGEFYILNKNNGKIVLSGSLNISKVQASDFILNDIDATPVIRNNVLYIVGNGGLLTAINLNSLRTIWEKEIATTSDFWVTNDFLFIIDNSASLHCLNAKNGEVKWTKQFPRFKNEKKQKGQIAYFSVVMAGDNLVITNSREKILLVSSQNGEILQKRKIGNRIGHIPVFVNSKMYLHVLDNWSSDLVIL